MKNSSNLTRKELQLKMMTTLQNELQSLNPQLQSILIDDMITAFYNRLVVMQRFC